MDECGCKLMSRQGRKEFKYKCISLLSFIIIQLTDMTINRCGEVEGRNQEYFGLYMNLPEESQDSIQDAITAYMGADERELKCTKCSHNQASVVTSVTRPPR